MNQYQQYCVDEILAEVVASKCLGKSPRLGKLLGYLLQKNAEENWRALKQFAIAVDVFSRNENFDATVDSIVRVEMHRLRKALNDYNQQATRFTVKIPSGGYRVIVDEIEIVEAIEPSKIAIDTVKFPKFIRSLFLHNAIAVSGLLLVIVLFFGPILVKGDLTNAASCSSNVPNISLSGQGANTNEVTGALEIIQSVMSQHSAVNVVPYKVKCKGLTPRLYVSVHSIQLRDGLKTTLKAYHLKPANIIHHANVGVSNSPDYRILYNDIIRSTIDMVKPYGSLPRYAASIDWGDEEKRPSYACQIDMYDGYSDRSPSMYETYLGCLEKAASQDSPSLDTLGALATTYLQQHAGYYAPTVADPIASAQSIIDDVGENWINSSEMTIAKIIYESERADFRADRLRSVIWDAEQRYPSNSIVILNAAVRTGFKLGDWEKAKLMSEKVKSIHSGRDSSVYVVDAAYALLFDDKKVLMNTCMKVYTENSFISNILVNSCAQKSNNFDWQLKTRHNLNAMMKGTTMSNVEFIQNRKFETTLSAELINYANLTPL